MSSVRVIVMLGEAKKHSVKYVGEDQAVKDGLAPSAVYVPNALIRKLIEGTTWTTPPDEMRITFEIV